MISSARRTTSSSATWCRPAICERRWRTVSVGPRLGCSSSLVGPIDEFIPSSTSAYSYFIFSQATSRKFWALGGVVGLSRRPRHEIKSSLTADTKLEGFHGDFIGTTCGEKTFLVQYVVQVRLAEVDFRCTREMLRVVGGFVVVGVGLRGHLVSGKENKPAFTARAVCQSRNSPPGHCLRGFCLAVGRCLPWDSIPLYALGVRLRVVGVHRLLAGQPSLVGAGT